MDTMDDNKYVRDILHLAEVDPYALQCLFASNDLLTYVKYSTREYDVGWVHEEICNALNRVEQGILNKESPRLIITTPPRIGKSFISSERLPAYWLARHPHWGFIGASYSADLSSGFTHRCKELMLSDYHQEVFPDSKLAADTKRKNYFRTVEGGYYKSTGIGGSLTGMGAHCLIIDDVVKDWKTAHSKIIKTDTLDWFQSTAYTRLAPGGGIIMIMTRWAYDDLAGTMIDNMSNGGEKWEVLHYPAIAERDEPHRKKGEALHPSRWPLVDLLRTKKTIGDRKFSALYQNRPIVIGGDYIKREWFNGCIIKEDQVPQGLRWSRFYDLGVKAKKYNDPTASIAGAIDKNTGIFYIKDLYQWRLKWGKAKYKILDIAKKELYPIGIEDNASFDFGVEDMIELLNGLCSVTGYTSSKDKLTRALGWTGDAEVGKMRIIDGPYVETILEQMDGFNPELDKVHDDIIDAISGTYLMSRGRGIFCL